MKKLFNEFKRQWGWMLFLAGLLFGGCGADGAQDSDLSTGGNTWTSSGAPVNATGGQSASTGGASSIPATHVSSSTTGGATVAIASGGALATTGGNGARATGGTSAAPPVNVCDAIGLKLPPAGGRICMWCCISKNEVNPYWQCEETGPGVPLLPCP